MDNYRILGQEQIRQISSPFRQRILESLSVPASASGLARQLKLSRQRVGYHMRDLERCGAIEVVQEQKVRGLKEKLYKSLPMAYVISPTPSEARVKMQDRYSWASLVNTLARALWDLMHLRKAADATEKQLATLAIDVEVYFDSPSKRKEFAEELVDFVEVLARRYEKPETTPSRAFRLVVGAYAATRKSSEDDGKTKKTH